MKPSEVLESADALGSADVPESSGILDSSDILESSDILVVGSGVAGLSAALELTALAPDRRVTVFTRGRAGGHGASPLAQGGVAAAIDPSDSPELHAYDTQQAADGLARSELVEILTRAAPERVRDLVRLGARFDRGESGDLSLGLEGAHSRRRILHAQGDRTGAEIMRALGDAVLAAPGIDVRESTEVVDLLVEGGRVVGALSRDATARVQRVPAAAVLLATGGPGRAYLRTTAPPGLDGDGLAMAARAGAVLRDLEFVQFHPTALAVEDDPLPLVTEALRGAGARLVDDRGESIHGSSEGGDLASRDRVARAIWGKIREGRRVFLDARELGDAGREAFPGVYALCRKHGIDPTREPIPVTPAAHYHMGGVAVDAEGRTSMRGLWAAGEVAASGLHGANRLASNSLLEGLVFGPLTARSIVRALETGESAAAGAESPAAGSESRAGGADLGPERRPKLPILPPEIVRRIRTVMWERVGIERRGPELEGAIRELDAMEAAFAPMTEPHARNLLLTARLIARAALLRTESLGSHFREDHPSRSGGRPRHSVLSLALGADGTTDQAVIQARMEEGAPGDPAYVAVDK